MRSDARQLRMLVPRQRRQELCCQQTPTRVLSCLPEWRRTVRAMGSPGFKQVNRVVCIVGKPVSHRGLSCLPEWGAL